jgi:hypothetical protein
MDRPARLDGRLRALCAAAAAGLDIATFVVQALWLVCLLGLVVLVVAIIAGVSRAIL